MIIQIFGTKKSSDTRKAERYFKERGIKFQFVDLKEKGMSKGEFQSVLQAVGSLEAMVDQNCKDKDLLALIKYIAEEDKAQKPLLPASSGPINSSFVMRCVYGQKCEN